MKDAPSPRAIVALVVGGACLFALAVAAPVLWWTRGGPASFLGADEAAPPTAPAAPPLAATTDPRLLAAREDREAGRLETASARYEELLAERPGDAELGREYAYLLAERAERLLETNAFDQASPLAERAVRLAPGEARIAAFYADLSLAQAAAHGRARRPDLALAVLAHAVEVAPNDARLHAHLGLAYYEKEDLRLARRHLERARGLDPSSPVSRGVAALLERVEVEAEASAGFREADWGDFVIRYEGYAGPDLGQTLRTVLPQAEGDVRNRLGFGPTPPLTVLCYGSGTFRTVWGLPDWAGGVYDGKIRLPVAAVERGGERLGELLRHEVAHAAVASVGGAGVPVWLHEGIAQWAEHGGVPFETRWVAEAAARDERWVPLGAIHASFLSLGEEAAGIAYAESAVAVGYLMHRYGPGGVERLLRAIGEGADLETALRTHFQIGLDDLDRAVRESL